MPRIHFEAADSTERTQIGEGLVRFAVQAGRLETGREEGRYFLQHADGCGEDGDRIAPGDSFFFDTESGEILCDRHGRERSGGEEETGGKSGSEGEEGSEEEGGSAERRR